MIGTDGHVMPLLSVSISPASNGRERMLATEMLEPVFLQWARENDALGMTQTRILILVVMDSNTEMEELEDYKQ